MYGAVQFSKDIDFLILADAENFERLRAALAELRAERIAIPPFASEHLARTHGGGASGTSARPRILGAAQG